MFIAQLIGLTMKRDNLFLIPTIIIAFFVIGIIFRELRELLVPFAIAVLFSILFNPLVQELPNYQNKFDQILNNACRDR